MSGILYLNVNDFKLHNTKNGVLMGCGIRGISLILIYSKQCPHCSRLLPIFKQLPGTLEGCQFGLIDVTHDRRIISMSTKSIAPVAHVPYILLYINGMPFMKYKGDNTADSIRQFVIDIDKKLRTRQKARKEYLKKEYIQKNKKKIPGYSIGIPLYGNNDEGDYLDFITAYGN